MSRIKLLRISTVNLLVLVLVVLLLRGRPSLSEIQQQLRPGMTTEQVTRILGTSENLRWVEMTWIILNPSTPESPAILNFRRDVDAAHCAFSMPERLRPTMRNDKPNTFLWLDTQHALLLHFSDDGLLQEILLVPNKLEPATFQEWCKHQFNRFKRAVGI
jgi:hypothetical protein